MSFATKTIGLLLCFQCCRLKHSVPKIFIETVKNIGAVFSLLPKFY